VLIHGGPDLFSGRERRSVTGSCWIRNTQEFAAVQ
jgi:hypothetical protein